MYKGLMKWNKNNNREVSEMVGKEHKNLIRDIRNYVEVLQGSNLSSENFFIESEYFNSRNQKQPCYELTKQGCEMVANKMTGEKGILFTATYVQRFNEMEQKQQQQFNLPTTYKEALLQLVQAEEEKEQLLLEKQNLEYTNNILTHTNKTYTTTEIAKELNLNSARELNRRLCKDKIQFIQNGTYVLYSDYANKGYTSIKQTVLDDDRIVYNTRWTDLGREFILKKYSQVGFEV
jgi:Rha family phage regulatory protein